MKTLTFIDDTTVEIDGEVFRKDVPPEPAPKPSKPEFKVGDWVIRTVEAGHPHHIDKVFRITDIVDNGLKEDEITHMVSSCRLATPSEIESHLQKVAEEKGYKGRMKLVPLNGFCGDHIEYRREVYFSYRKELDRLEMNGTGIYEKGKWAEILPDKKPVPKTRDEFKDMIKTWNEGRTYSRIPDFLDNYDF